MSHQHVISFWRKVKNDKGLQDALVALEAHAEEQRPGKVAKLGEEKGLSFTDKELLEVEAVFAFWQKMKSDTTLQKAVEPLDRLGADDAAQGLVKIASDAGFSFSSQALDAAATSMVGLGELHEAQLEAVAGGVSSVGTSYNLALRGGFDSTKFTPGIRAFYV